jgi:hypothetical protein
MVDVIQIIKSSGAKFSYGCNPIFFRGIQAAIHGRVPVRPLRRRRLVEDDRAVLVVA